MGKKSTNDPKRELDWDKIELLQEKHVLNDTKLAERAGVSNAHGASPEVAPAVAAGLGLVGACTGLSGQGTPAIVDDAPSESNGPPGCAPSVAATSAR